MLLKLRHLTDYAVARVLWLAKMYKKQKGLEIESENLEKIHVIEIKIFS